MVERIFQSKLISRRRNINMLSYGGLKVTFIMMSRFLWIFLTSNRIVNDIVTNMESRFPAMWVLWLGREFYRDKYGTDSSHVWSPDLGDHLGDKFGDGIWDLKGAGIFSISLLSEEIRLNVLEDCM
ncbi:hypothetical protein AVEN_82375-1 [Araneus ventricosus]|uniref:Uncharacterized protein n=1 Tax=Araneus ventricosus TaxID=182803 RepID=A0A4Y2HIY0_ARAVE|nr:hypothetical protein AVEN_82375-1 [Araneus ventricosus]